MLERLELQLRDVRVGVRDQANVAEVLAERPRLVPRVLEQVAAGVSASAISKCKATHVLTPDSALWRRLWAFMTREALVRLGTFLDFFLRFCIGVAILLSARDFGEPRRSRQGEQ